MLLSQHDHVIQTLAPDGAHQPLRKRVLPGALRCCQKFGDPHVFEATPETFPVDLVPVSDQVSRRRVFGKRFQDLLSGPSRGRMLGHVEMNHIAPTMRQDHQNEQDPKGRGRHREEIDGDQFVDVIVEEDPPGLRRRSTFLGRTRDTVRSEMWIPSLSSSPWMRGAPQIGLAAAIFRIRARMAGVTSGRPVLRLEIQVQNRRKPLPCQATTVSGLTITSARRQSFQLLDSHTQKKRSMARSRGRGHFRLKTASC